MIPTIVRNPYKKSLSILVSPVMLWSQKTVMFSSDVCPNPNLCVFCQEWDAKMALASLRNNIETVP